MVAFFDIMTEDGEFKDMWMPYDMAEKILSSRKYNDFLSKIKTKIKYKLVSSNNYDEVIKTGYINRRVFYRNCKPQEMYKITNTTDSITTYVMEIYDAEEYLAADKDTTLTKVLMSYFEYLAFFERANEML